MSNVENVMHLFGTKVGR